MREAGLPQPANLFDRISHHNAFLKLMALVED
jgi:hypothetical protein